jgi:non-haem Fe2+, alpha-ketoglutarate-dependent halogenase
MKDLKQDYLENGWLGPLPVFNHDEIKHYRNELFKVSDSKDFMTSDYRCKSNVLFPWVDEMSRHPILRAYIEQLIGPNFHCWDVLFWIKHPGDHKTVGFHQDATYWNFNNKHKAVSAWIAFDDVTEDQGPIQYAIDRHRFEQKSHLDIKSDNNLLMRGQTVDESISDVISSPCSAGSAMIHSPFIVHGSQANRSNRIRAACGMVFVSTECEPLIKNARESTLMIQGEDHFNFMDHDPRPGPIHKENLINWKKSYDQQHTNYFALHQSGV